jgi:transposase
MSAVACTRVGCQRALRKKDLEITRLRNQQERTQRRCDTLEEIVAKLSVRVEELERSEKRQACPFAKERPKRARKKPGRKSGDAHGPTDSRPKPDRIDRFLDAPVADECPCCGGEVVLDGVANQIQWDLPPVQPIVTQFNIEVGHCRDCRRRVQGRHPEQTSDALGAASHQVGPNVIALATHLNKIMGASYAKTSVFLRQAFHLRVQPSTLVRALQRLSTRVDAAYRKVRDVVRTSPAVYPDETGYRVGGHTAWLWVFVSESAVLYRVAAGRGFAVAAWALGKDYAGFLGHDGWGVYDRFHLAIHQTCLRHLIVRCKDLLSVATRRQVSFPRRLLEILRRAFRVRDDIVEGKLSPRQETRAIAELHRDLDAALAMELTYAPNARLKKHILVHRPQMLTFVEHAGQVEGANFLAEQAIRPAVIIRKISGCNKTWKGAHVHEVLTSVMRTAVRRSVDGLDYLVDALRQRPNPAWLPQFLADP